MYVSFCNQIWQYRGHKVAEALTQLYLFWITSSFIPWLPNISDWMIIESGAGGWQIIRSSYLSASLFNTLRPRQNGRHVPDDIFKRIFLNENVIISIKISLKFVPKSQITNNLSLVQIMAWRRSGDKPLSEPMMVSLVTHICVTRPQWVNANKFGAIYSLTSNKSALF